MIIYYQLTKIGKKNREASKLGRNGSKLDKIEKTWKKSYYAHFDLRKIHKNYKIRVILNKE